MKRSTTTSPIHATLQNIPETAKLAREYQYAGFTDIVENNWDEELGITNWWREHANPRDQYLASPNEVIGNSARIGPFL